MSSVAPAAARADFCRFLAACYYEPCVEFAEERIFDSMRAAAAGLGPELAEGVARLGAAFRQNDLQDLLIDYTQLFLGPVEPVAQPYECAWRRDDGLMHDAAGELSALYGEAGFAMDEGFHDLPDHVAAELEFLYLLIHCGATDLERRFLEQHLGTWVAPFTHAVDAGARSDFYRILAGLTGRFIRMETERLEREAA
jgi:TorA maturation chaperone TorD